MSAWLIGLGLATAYLMKKNVTMQERLESQAKKFTEQAKPADGLKTEQIRDVQRTVPDSEKYQDMNLQDLDRNDVNNIVEARASAAKKVVEYESRVAPTIEGVYLHYDRHGI